MAYHTVCCDIDPFDLIDWLRERWESLLVVRYSNSIELHPFRIRNECPMRLISLILISMLTGVSHLPVSTRPTYPALSSPLTLPPSTSIFALRLPNCTALFLSPAALANPKPPATLLKSLLSPRASFIPGWHFSSALKEDKNRITRSSRKGYRISRLKWLIIRSSLPRLRYGSRVKSWSSYLC